MFVPVFGSDTFRSAKYVDRTDIFELAAPENPDILGGGVVLDLRTTQ